MESRFGELADALDRLVRAGEVALLSLAAERSDFVRFNHGRIRQAGRVEQVYATLRLVDGARHAEACITLAGTPADHHGRLAATIARLRALLPDLDADPHLLINRNPRSTRSVRRGAIPAAASIADRVVDSAGGRDLVGFLATGPVYRGFANSLGQRNWHETETFDLQWSLYHHADKAMKSGYADLTWDDAAFAARMRATGEQHEALGHAARTLVPGDYRVFLAPAAMAEFAQLLCWGGFSGRSRATRQGCLLRMQDGAARLDQAIHVAENFAGGTAPNFQADGFLRPDRVELLRGGELGDALVSPRTAREFDLSHNGANAWEMPEALEFAPGTLPGPDVLRRLGTGIYVGNLWYLNYSDRPAGRITGMTRFGTFWVENGSIVAPINVMRFDDTVYRMLGERLEALTDRAELAPDSLTWRERSVSAMRVPGALLSGLTLTL